jgi:hypothetical protein
MLLEQPHPTVQHKELLAKHFGVERKHVDNFLSWRIACLHSEDNDVRREDIQREPRKDLPAPFYDDDTMDVDKPLGSRPYLHTPSSSSTSPEPVESMTPFIRTKLHHRPTIDTSSLASREHQSSWLASPASLIESNSPSRRPSNATHSQVNSPVATSPTSHAQLSPTKPTPISPSSSSPSASPNVHTRQEHRSRTHTSVAPVGNPPQAAAPRIPHSLSEFEEAYAPAYERIERFLKDVESNKYVHVGLTPEMLKQIKP